MANRMNKADPDFGEMQFNGLDAWDCHFAFDLPHPPTWYFAIHVWADERGPTERQRQVMRWLPAAYAGLWPNVANRIIGLHPGLQDREALRLREWVSVYIGEDSEDSLQLVYDLDEPEDGNRAYFITISDGNIVDAYVAD